MIVCTSGKFLRLDHPSHLYSIFNLIFKFWSIYTIPYIGVGNGGPGGPWPSHFFARHRIVCMVQRSRVKRAPPHSQSPSYTSAIFLDSVCDYKIWKGRFNLAYQRANKKIITLKRYLACDHDVGAAEFVRACIS